MSKRLRLQVQLWRAIAGPMVHIPPLYSKAYYFPLGHLLEASEIPEGVTPETPDGLTASALTHRSRYLCFVEEVRFGIDENTEDAFCTLTLLPVDDNPEYNPNPNVTIYPYFHDYGGKRMLSVAKVLKPSDLKKELCIPDSCMGYVFPEFDSSQSNKFQVKSLTFVDAHDRVWKFDFMYNKKKKKQTLLDGWEMFVRRKRLVAGDSVVFMKDPPTQALYIGIRRGPSKSGKESPESVKNAIESASRKERFTVRFCATSGRPLFVVKRGAVEDAMKIRWHAGMPVKMAVEIEEWNQLNWVRGKIFHVRPNGPNPRRAPCWRMLQIQWDKQAGELKPSDPWVSPWQVVIDTPEVETEETDAAGTSEVEFLTKEKWDKLQTRKGKSNAGKVARAV